MTPQFAKRCIAHLQNADRKPELVGILTHVLCEAGLILWDDARALFWACIPGERPQVAIWLMDTAIKFEPVREGREAMATTLEQGQTR